MIAAPFPFNDELDVLEIKLAALDPLVDVFVLSEATTTHAGQPKPLYYRDNRDRYQAWNRKIEHVVWDEPIGGAWEREHTQRRRMNQSVDLSPDDVILLTDCDEIPAPDAWEEGIAIARSGGVGIPRLAMHVYRLRWRWPQTWPAACRFLTKATLDGLYGGDLETCVRTYDLPGWGGVVYGPEEPPGKGWHLAYQGGADAIARKFAGMAHRELARAPYNTPEQIDRCIKTGADIFDRPERQAQPAPLHDMPEYLQRHFERFEHLW